MNDRTLPNVRDIVYMTKTIGPLRRGAEVIVREVHPHHDPYVITVEPTPKFFSHYVQMDMPLTYGEWVDFLDQLDEVEPGVVSMRGRYRATR